MTKFCYYDKEETTEEKRETEKISEEDVGKMEDETGLGGEEHHGDGPYEDPGKEDEVPTRSAEETTKDVTDEESVIKSPVPEPETKEEADPTPKEGEDHEVFCNRYMNHLNILRRITPPYRRAAAEAVWKEFHA
jgi:hypothetical protein